VNLTAALRSARGRAREFFLAQRWERGAELFWRHSATHDPAAAPAHLLYGTWAGVLGTKLIDGPDAFDESARDGIHRALCGFQRDDGAFFLPGLTAADLGGHSEEYLAFHCTNYAWGALHALGMSPRRPPTFLAPLRRADGLAAWLAARDLARPWVEGNNCVNLASFFFLLAEAGDTDAEERLGELILWHDGLQQAETGLWHAGDARDRAVLLDALAGAAHTLHLYYHTGRPVPRAEAIVESCLRLGYPGISSACIDLDVIELLCNLRGSGYRRPEIDRTLSRYLIELLQVQNADGGFCDNYVTPHRLYGHTTPAGRSVTWVTWFRLTAIGMIACTFGEDDGANWWFRDTVGSGYFHPARVTTAVRAPASVAPAAPLGTTPTWLALRRSGRWLRQRTLYSIRQAWRRASIRSSAGGSR
jgi:hypothetical protein